MNKRRMRPLPKIIISLLLVFIAFLFVLGVSELFRREKVYPIHYREEVKSASEKFGIDESTVFAVIYCESGFDKDAVSNMGAVGLMQILPETLEWLCEKDGVDYSEDFLTSPEKNIYYGTMFMSILYDYFENWDAVHAAYHAGHTRVRNWLDEGVCVIDADGNLFGIPIDATRVYVDRINAAKDGYIKTLEKEQK